MPPKQRSKKGKKEWRKNIDISQEEEALAAARREQIYGGAPEQKEDSELFFEDKKQTSLTKKEIARAKALSATVRLQSNSSVPARPPQSAPVDYTAKQVQKIAKKLEAGVPLGAANRKTISFAKATNHDLWDDAQSTQQESEENEWIPKVEPPPRPESLIEKPSLLPAVPAPIGAASYRPTNKDLRKLKQEVIKERAKRKAAAQKLEEALSYPSSLRHLSAEMKVDTQPDPEEQAEESDGDDGLPKEDAKFHFSTALTEKERRKMKLKAARKRKEAKLARRAKQGDFTERVDHLLEKIEEREKEIEQRTLERQKKKEAKLYQPLKLNPGKVRPENKAELLHKPAKTLTESLKSTDGFRDRLRSLQVRNILEPKKRISKRNKERGVRWVMMQSYKDD